VIIFSAEIVLDEGTNLNVVPSGRRFSPNLMFDLPQISGERFGLTVVEPERRIESGGRGNCRVEMIGVPEFAPIAEGIAPGTKFTLWQGPYLLGSGVVLSVQDRIIDKQS
jgi:hypothetical protein